MLCAMARGTEVFRAPELQRRIYAIGHETILYSPHSHSCLFARCRQAVVQAASRVEELGNKQTKAPGFVDFGRIPSSIG